MLAPSAVFSGFLHSKTQNLLELFRQGRILCTLMNYLEHLIKTPVMEATNEHSLLTRYCSRPEDTAVNKTKIPALKELVCQWGEKNTQATHL